MTPRSCFRLISCLLFTSLVELTFAQEIGSLAFRDVFVVPFEFRFQGTQVGGLSGIDFDSKTGTYYLISDDRSSLHLARYYTADIRISEKGIDTVIFTSKVDLHGPDGKSYPKNSLDPEALRYNPTKDELIWTSEGERIVNKKDTILKDPGIFIIKDGKFVDQFPVPANARMAASEQGPRNNGAFEALSFADNYKTLWVGLEEPLFQDGPRADVEDSYSPVRFYKFDLATKANTAQYAYELESVAHKPLLTTAFRVNGVPDFLEAGPNQLFVIERSFTTGRLPCTIKIFLADVGSATDIKDIASLKDTKVQLITKKLLFNMDMLGRHIDNVEGITWGPKLPNGNRSLLLISDNNFQSIEETQIFLLEVLASK